MLKSWNNTTITLIPKVPNPLHPGDFRPISCCHVLYNCISKLICSKLKLVLDFLIDQAQGAFVEMMAALNFPHKFIKTIMTYITSTSYVLMINGSPTYFFAARRGLRQFNQYFASSSLI
ncbi:uncharacterized protein LOC130805490 [Amaranthus tricolor]|uniref:uncharacterized protein LOC130805490 n=1 Tax=Amaranthus tricolor TaxID=29722 RepID=UPI0025842F9F|nr:uncharacterized protein LOC130805490 [Amaranthus tricolor]